MKPRTLDLADLDAVIAEVHRLKTSGYDKAGNWELAQMCQHVAIPIVDCMDGFTFKAPLPFRVLGPLVIKNQIFKTRKLRDGIKAPPTLEPPANLDTDAEVKKLEAAIARLKAHEGKLHPSPFLGELSKAEWMEFNTIHAMHHLRYLIPKIS